MLILPEHYRNTEHTLVMIKPKTEEYTGQTQEEILKIIEEKMTYSECTILDQYDKIFTKEEASLHYKHLSLLGFFPKIVEYIMSGNNKLLLIEGNNAIKTMDSIKKSIRKEFGCHPGLLDWMYNDKPYKNILHASDSEKEAFRETRRYFPKFFEYNL